MPACDLNTSNGKAFTLMDANESLHFATAEQFCKRLQCTDAAKLKVVSIFGNTGDGKSHTMNNAFFNGENVFKTSAEQESCTLGIFAALQPEMGVLCLDTEGLLSTSSPSHSRMRMLLKVMYKIWIYDSYMDRMTHILLTIVNNYTDISYIRCGSIQDKIRKIAFRHV